MGHAARLPLLAAALTVAVLLGPRVANFSNNAADPSTLPATSGTGGSFRAGTPLDQVDSANFFLDAAGNPVRWDACGTINWVLRVGPGPADAESIARRAIHELSRAAGLVFSYAGRTSELVTSGPDASDRTIYISWATPSEVPALRDEVAGVGGPKYREASDGLPKVGGGFAVVDASQGLAPGYSNGASDGAVLLHELGHAVGLAHTPDRSRLMFPSTVETLSAAYQPGDLGALATAVSDRSCSAG